MIPTMILLGFVLGRWRWLSLVIAAVGWPVILLVTNVLHVYYRLIEAAALAAANAAVGVLIYQGCARTVRALRGRSPRPGSR
jgi:hypothetical protein